MPEACASVAVDDVAAERRPVRSLVARLLEELATGGGERLLAVVEVAADRGERCPVDGVLRLPEDEERPVVGDGDDVDELAADDPRPVLDDLAVGQLDDVALDGQPRAPLENASAASASSRGASRVVPAGRLVQRDRPGRGDVQGLGRARQRDRDAS